MRFCIISADAKGQIDGVCSKIYQHIPQARVERCDAVIVPVSYYPNYTFNPALRFIKKPVILIDFIEYSWSWDQQQSNLIGDGSFRNYGHLNTPEWERLDAWVAEFPPNIVFKRELLSRDENECRLPVEWPCMVPARPVQTEQEFLSRQVSVFSCWGMSHMLRQKLHGDIFTGAHHHGYHVVDHWDDQLINGTWATIHVPYQRRRHIDGIIDWNCMSRLSVSLHGAGVKCFRHSEAPVGSVMALQEDRLAWSVPWEHGVNCIRLKFGREFESLLSEVGRSDLYQLYLASQESVDRLRPARYATEYIVRSIEERL